ncbi:MAG: biopolymer transporter ExbD [Kiritimatiellae bacterium]|jgi:biopolymer transport protein ExbD|nr:biopolymer transporter ExbD [Kiritimatiellia bacterium]
MRTNLQDEEMIEVAMAPLIDCVFLLLIFFLVATTLKKVDHELPLTLPGAQTSVEVQQPDEYMVVSLDQNGDLYIDGAPVGAAVLQQSVRDRARANRDLKVRVDAHASIPFQQVMQVLDILRFEQLHNIGINSREASPRAK